MKTPPRLLLLLLPLALALVGSAAAADSGSAAAATIPPAAHSTSLAWGTIAVGALGLALLLYGVHRASLTVAQRWNIGRRLAAGFSLLLVVLAGLAAESCFSLRTAYLEFEEYRSDARNSLLATGLQETVYELRLVAAQYSLHGDAAAAVAYGTLKTDLARKLQEARQTISVGEFGGQLDRMDAAAARHAALFGDLEKAVGSGRSDRAAVERSLAEVGTALDRESHQLEQLFIARQTEDGPRIDAELRHTASLVLWVAVASVLLGAGLAYCITRSIVGPLRDVAASLGAGAEQAAAAADQVSASSQSLAMGATEQAASLEETSASLEELSSMTKRNAASSSEANRSASAARAAADTGGRQMQAMQDAMNAIKDASDDIAKILKTIDEIAFQTNLLALNAAVEAARAGEHGMGFAVVADEVRALAQRSAAAAKDTATRVVESAHKSQQGVTISSEVAQSFAAIRQRIESLDGLVAEISTATSEQSRGVGQLSAAVSQIDQVTQNNAASAEETAAAAEELNGQAQMLKHAVHQLELLTGARAGATLPAPVSVRTSVPPVRGPGAGRNHSRTAARPGAFAGVN